MAVKKSRYSSLWNSAISANRTSSALSGTNSQKKNTEWGLLPGYFSNNFVSPDRDTNMLLAMNDGTDDLAHKQAWSDFDRFYTVDLEREVPSGRHYIFFCRPDLYLVEEGSATGSEIVLSSKSRVNVDPYFTYLAQFHPEIIASLTGDFAGLKSLQNTSKSAAAGSGYGNSRTSDGSSVAGINLTIHAFMPYLTSRVETFELPDYTIDQNAIVQPYTKYTIPYTTSALKSSSGGSFNITFREDKYYSLHKLFYAWIYYQNNVMRNIFSPKDKYIKYNAIDYATSIYDFVVDATGENIIYWSKYTGCIPTSVPMSDLGFNRNSGGETKISVPFSYFFCEHMDRNILTDFQYNSLGYIAVRSSQIKNKVLNPFSMKLTTPIYNENTFLGKNFVGRPVIFYGKQSGENVFKLRWLPS